MAFGRVHSKKAAAAVGMLFVYRCAVESEGPGLKVPSRIKMSDLLIRDARRRLTLAQCTLELLEPPVSVAFVRLDHHNNALQRASTAPDSEPLRSRTAHEPTALHSLCHGAVLVSL